MMEQFYIKIGHGKGASEAIGEETEQGTTSENVTNCEKATSYCFYCLGVIIVMALVGLEMAKIAMGSIYYDDCNLQSMIPIFLIVSGLAPILFCGDAICNNEGSNFIANYCCMIAVLFNLAWTVAGSVWVYSTWGLVKTEGYVLCAANVTNFKSCNEVVLTFAFATVTIDWTFIGFFIVYAFCSLSE